MSEKALADIAAERKRQIEIEGWSLPHDDEHVDGAMAFAAACYAIGRDRVGTGRWLLWPWADEWWKPSKDHRRNLIKAGALIVAEIERIDRRSLKQPPNPSSNSRD